MTTADIFSMYFLGIDYAEITDLNNRASIDDLLRTGEAGVMKALTAKRAAMKAMMAGGGQSDPIPTITLTLAQEAEADALARTMYKSELCALCAARQAIIRRDILTRGKDD